MPIRLEPADPDADYPGEDIAPMNAIAWGKLLWPLYRWGADLTGFRYDNHGYLIPGNICRRAADTIEAHLDELPPDEREWWAAQIPYWRHCGGFFQRGKRETF